MQEKIKPIPEKHPVPPFKNKFYTEKYGNYIKAWKWKNKKGEWLFCTVRYERDGKKNVVPFFYNITKEKWINKQPLEKKRPLLDSDIIFDNPEKDVLLVEGEKCYQAAKEIFGHDFNFIVTTWCGGTGGITKTDWSLIKDRKVYYWFDHDNPGYKTIDVLKEKLNNLIIVQPPINKPEGWDIADAIQDDKWSYDNIIRFILSGVKIDDYLPPGVIREKKRKFIENEDIEFPFEILGYNKGYMFFLPEGTRQITKIKQGSLNYNYLYQALAPLEFWQDEKNYGEWSKQGIKVRWMDAIGDIIKICNRKGPFEDKHIRGRGAWNDNGNIIIHTGKHIITQENKILLNKYQTNGHVYERLPELKLNIEKKDMTEALHKKIVDCFRGLSIETKLELNCLIGWCVLAWLCGGLQWRPHIWLTGSSGTGKSTIIDMIIHRILGNFKICPLSNSTGPGILQFLTNDSLPVVFDEAENNIFTYSNIKGVLDIARAASSANEDQFLMKGTAEQTGKAYKNNSMFCLSSVNTLLDKKSDRSRFTTINLTKNLKISWNELSKMIIDTFSHENCKIIRSHIFYNWDIIKENIRTFRQAAGIYLNDQRAGDQYGTLFSGAASLLNMKKYNYDTVLNMCVKNLQDIQLNEENLSDEIECLFKIMTSKIRYINYAEKNEETTLLNLVNMSMDENNEIARKTLLKYGIKTDYIKNKIYIACNYEWIRDILKATPWQYNYSKVIRRLEFVNKKTVMTYFDSYWTGRAIEIDSKYIVRLSDDNVFMEGGF